MSPTADCTKPDKYDRYLADIFYQPGLLSAFLPDAARRHVTIRARLRPAYVTGAAAPWTVSLEAPGVAQPLHSPASPGHLGMTQLGGIFG